MNTFRSIITVTIIFITYQSAYTTDQKVSIDIAAFMTPNTVPWDVLENAYEKPVIERLTLLLGADFLAADGSLNPKRFSEILEQKDGSLLGVARHQTKINEKVQSQFYYPVSYFESQKDNIYVLKKTNPGESPGAEISVKLMNPEPNKFIFEYVFTISLIKQRAKIPDIDCAVGKPELSQNTLTNTKDMEIGQWKILTISTIGEGSDAKQYLIWVLSRINPD